MALTAVDVVRELHGCSAEEAELILAHLREVDETERRAISRMPEIYKERGRRFEEWFA